MTTMTDGRRAAGTLRLRLDPAQRAWVWTVTVAAAATALFVIVVRPLPQPVDALTLPWVVWVLAFAVSEVLVVHVHMERDSHTFSLSDLVLAAGLCLAPP